MNMWPVLEIVRLEEGFFGTKGVLRINKQVFSWTYEPFDTLNERGTSSIPAQQYLVSWVTSHQFGRTLEVLDVPFRSGILFHPGNVEDDTEGCILPGYGSKIDGVTDSRRAWEDLMRLLSVHEKMSLTIRECY